MADVFTNRSVSPRVESSLRSLKGAKAVATGIIDNSAAKPVQASILKGGAKTLPLGTKSMQARKG